MAYTSETFLTNLKNNMTKKQKEKKIVSLYSKMIKLTKAKDISKLNTSEIVELSIKIAVLRQEVFIIKAIPTNK